jgi:transposase-like protein
MEKPRKGPSKGAIAIYDPSFKIAVVREYLTGEYSESQVAKKHNLSDKTMNYFVHWYRKNFPEPTSSAVVELVKSDKQQAGLSSAELEKKLAYANLKITALEILISNAEREMGVDIRKKAGSKPSTK